MTDGFDDAGAYGFIDGLDDPSMGWARYAQAVKHMNLNSGLFYVRANRNTVALMERLAERLAREKYWDQTAFNEEIFFLSHGAVARVPVSVRVMNYWLFQNSKARSPAAETRGCARVLVARGCAFAEGLAATESGSRVGL